jgi:hypothetical protein
MIQINEKLKIMNKREEVENFDLNLILPTINSNMDIDSKIEMIQNQLKLEYCSDGQLLIYGYVSEPTIKDLIFEDVYLYEVNHLYNELLVQVYYQNDDYGNRSPLFLLALLDRLRKIYPLSDNIDGVYNRLFIKIMYYLYNFNNFSEMFLFNKIIDKNPIYFDTDRFYLYHRIPTIIKGKFDRYNLEFNLEETKIPYITFLGKKKYIQYIDGEFLIKGLGRKNKLKSEQLSVYNQFVNQVKSKERDKKLDILGI